MGVSDLTDLARRIEALTERGRWVSKNKQILDNDLLGCGDESP